MLLSPDTVRMIDTHYPLNPHHPLNQSRVAWWLAASQLAGGAFLYDLVNGLYTATLNSASWKSGIRVPGLYSIATGGGGYASAANPIKSALNLSLACWFITGNVNGQNAGIVDCRDTGAGEGVRIAVDSANPNNLIAIREHAFTNVQINGPALSVNTWYRVVVTVSGATMTLYLNGVSQGTNSVTGTLAGGSSIFFGKNYATSTYWTGWIDDISAWTRALSAAEVLEDFELGMAGYPGVLNYTPFTRIAAVPVVASGRPPIPLVVTPAFPYQLGL